MTFIDEKRSKASPAAADILSSCTVTKIAQAVLGAADAAVSDVPAEVRALGATNQQAQAVADAIKLYLIGAPGHEDAARQILIEGGFKNGNVDLMLTKLAAGTR